MTDPNTQQPQNPYSNPNQPYTGPQHGEPQPQAAYQQPAAAAPFTEAEDRQWAQWAHFGGALSFLALFTGWLGLFAVLPALIIYLAVGKRGRLTHTEAKEALNFQITMVGAMVVWAILAAITFPVIFFAPIGVWVALGLLFALVGWTLVIVDIVFSIVAGMRVNRGGSYRYPFIIRFVK